jgi:hypothetical protein
MVRPLKICAIGRLLVLALRDVMGFVASFLGPAVQGFRKGALARAMVVIDERLCWV